MERLKRMSLNKAFVFITIIFLLTATLLSAMSIILLAPFKSDGTAIIMTIDGDGTPTTDIITPTGEQGAAIQATTIGILQIGLPVLFYVTALLLSSMVFYRLKLKKPLAILQDGAERIRRQDLDFAVEKCADDELGALCAAFETMRSELLKSNRELWRQMEERKRLNAAFSHDLRNPVTVLKGSASMLQKGLKQGDLTEENAGEIVALIKQYAERIEYYVEAMTNAQKLEDLKFDPQPADWPGLAKEIENSLSILSRGIGKELDFVCGGEDRRINVDRYIIHNTAENLISNALRYAKEKISISLFCDVEKISIGVTDDGPGFPANILNKGAAPFSRDENSGQRTHFGMGLYICRLLCEKHGGNLLLENHTDGAKATAAFYF